jgi:hypothetical protein
VFQGGVHVSVVSGFSRAQVVGRCALSIFLYDSFDIFFVAFLIFDIFFVAFLIVSTFYKDYEHRPLRSYFTFSPFLIRGSQLTDKVRDVYFIQHPSSIRSIR